MIRGRFGGTSGRPFITAYLMFHAQGVKGEASFLLDTGADASVLMPMDGMRLGLDYSQLSTAYTSYGIGGRSEDFLEAATIVATDTGSIGSGDIYGFHVDLIIASSSAINMNVPSIIGRDILNRCDLRICKTKNILEINVLDSDFCE